MYRRSFLQTIGGGALAALPGWAAGRVKLGLDVYSLRAFRWKAMRLLDFAASQKLDAVQMSVDNFESTDPAHLAAVKAKADGYGIRIDAGTGRICPTTAKWNHRETPVEYIAEGLRVARAVGSKSVRCYVGNIGSRGGDPPFEAHVASTLRVLKAARSRVIDSGVRLAIENHGDFEARELMALIEEAGADMVGCCLDTGNPLHVMEDPLLTLEVLGPYALTTHVRDSAVFAYSRGAAFQWVALGDGSIDFHEWTARYRDICPEVPMQLEIITGRPPYLLPFYEKSFWKSFPNKPAADFNRFLRLVRNGHPFLGRMVIAGGDDMPDVYREALREQQRVDVERSARYAKQELGVGRS